MNKAVQGLSVDLAYNLFWGRNVQGTVTVRNTKMSLCSEGERDGCYHDSLREVK